LDFVSAEALGVDTLDLFDFDPFYIEPAYFGFLINPFVDGSGGLFYEGVIPAGTELEQQVSISNRGRVSETVFAGSVNYDDRLYLGFSMGFQRAVRDELMRFTETVVDTSATELDFFELNQDLEVRGDGVNFKFGAIFRATDNIRIGGSYTTPTWYSFSNTWSTDWYSKFDNGDTYSVPSEAIGLNDYRLRTPSRLTGSLGLIIGKQGLINVDYEYLNFSGAKFKRSGGSNIDFTRENVEIARQYTPVGNVRIGGEYRYNAMSFRGGFGYYPSPYEAGLTLNSADKYIYSGGIGYRKDRLNIDIAYRWTTFQRDYYPYDPDIIDPAAIQIDNYSILATLGVRF
jgi:long-subunit fatty acid transport protein